MTNQYFLSIQTESQRGFVNISVLFTIGSPDLAKYLICDKTVYIWKEKIKRTSPGFPLYSYTATRFTAL